MNPIEEIQTIMRRIERMRLAHPDTYRHTVGYLTDVDKLVVACRKLTLSLPPLPEKP
jgi:hypothetical protein